MELVRYDYTHDDVDLLGWLALPAGPGPHPAVMVMNSARGQGEEVRERARRLAGEGYLALVTDMYGGGKYHERSIDAGPDLASMHAQPDLFRARVLANYAALLARPEVDPARIAAIGFCFGGQCVLELARSGADVKAVVSYHGLLTTERPALPGAITAHVAVYTGGKDPYVPAEHVALFRQEMEAAGADYALTCFSRAYHAFTEVGALSHNIPGVQYDAVADSVSWAGTLALLDALVR